MSIAYIIFGSNLGDRLYNLQEALNLLQKSNIQVIASSPIYQTKAWGNVNQDDFLNMVLKIETSFKPQKLLKVLLKTELQMGRKRGEEQWLPRIIDLDILYFNEEIVNLPNLKIPHPYIAQRRFTLIPLTDIAADFVHPVLLETNKKLLKNCSDHSEVIKTDNTLSIIKTMAK